ncbi:MAG TPA: hypothetical protein VJ761_20895, partial [Ktedonobacteraceae bacterium]|nr:hypothetical protein [Ktedonobacteraceae bacterium]
RFTKAVELFQPLGKNTLNYRVKAGDIKTEKDKYGKIYEIGSLLRMRDMLIEDRFKESTKKRTIPNVILDWVQPEDIPSCLALDQIVYHEMFLASAEVYIAWRRKNPKISMGAFDAKDRRVCYGYIGLIPLPEAVILDVLMGKKDEKEITPDEILTYDKLGEYTLLANSAVIHTDYPELATVIIHAIMKFWIDHYPEQRIKRIYAQTVSEKGRAFAKKLYLGPLYIMGHEGLTRVEDAYVLDLQEEAVSKVIRQFQERLKAKEQQIKKKQ